MDFGVVLQTNPPASGVVAMMQRAEEAGFSYGWAWGSHVLWQEPLVLYSRGLVDRRHDVRHAERDVRYRDRVWGRPRRPAPGGHRQGADDPGHAVGGDD